MAVRKIELMHQLFGKSENESDICLKCSNFKHRVGGYSKCLAYGDTASEATDWKQKQQGCGLFNKSYNGKPVVRLVRPKKRLEEPIDGQISLFELMEGEEGMTRENTAQED